VNHDSSVLSNLLLLQELELREGNLALQPALRAELENRLHSIRALLPGSLLAHHDKMRAQGRLSLAPVEAGRCQACHLAISGKTMEQLQGQFDLMVCDQCGAAIYLATPKPK